MPDMAQNEGLERKNEILKRRISKMLLQENQEGLSSQDSQLMQKFIKELHHNSYQLNSKTSE
jgi:hypothetical protein